MNRSEAQAANIAAIEAAVNALSDAKFQEWVNTPDALTWVEANVLDPNNIPRRWALTAENRMVDRGNLLADLNINRMKADGTIARMNDARALALQIQDQNQE